MVNAIKKLFSYPFWIIILLSIPTIWALLIPGFYGASDDLHIGWLFEIDRVIKMGQIPPRFVPDLSFGFGYPLFNFVFPLPFYIAEIFHLLSLNLVDSIKLVFLLSMPLSGIFMYLFLREFTTNLLSLSGAILYIYTPYRAVDVYVRGAIGEIVSFVFLPMIALSLLRIKKTGSLRWMGIGAISLASLTLSHNITAYMFFPFVVLLIILLWDAKKSPEYPVNIFKTIFLALLMSSYFWLPAISESSLMKYDTVFNFMDHFPTIKQLITPYWGYGASVPGPYDGMSFFLGYVNILVLAGGTFFTILNWKKFEKLEKKMFFWAAVGLITALFLMNFRSGFIWNSLPLLPYFQFPWRFLSLTTFFTPVFLIGFKYLKIKDSLTVFLIIITLLTSWSYFRPQDFLGRVDSYYLNRYIPYPKASNEYSKTQEEYLRLPKDTQIRPQANYPVFFSMNDEIVDVSRINDLHFFVNLNPKMELRANFNKYYFPGWVAKLDGKEVAIKPGAPFGQLNILVPAGPHKLEIYFKETNFKLLLDFASLSAFLVSLGIIFRKNKQ